jgi:hypothetical protein
MVPAVGKAGRTLEPWCSRPVMDNTARVQVKEREKERVSHISNMIHQPEERIIGFKY